MIYGYIRVSSDKQTVENQRFICQSPDTLESVTASSISLIYVSSAFFLPLHDSKSATPINMYNTFFILNQPLRLYLQSSKYHQMRAPTIMAGKNHQGRIQAFQF